MHCTINVCLRPWPPDRLLVRWSRPIVGPLLVSALSVVLLATSSSGMDLSLKLWGSITSTCFHLASVNDVVGFLWGKGPLTCEAVRDDGLERRI